MESFSFAGKHLGLFVALYVIVNGLGIINLVTMSFQGPDPISVLSILLFFSLAILLCVFLCTLQKRTRMTAGFWYQWFFSLAIVVYTVSLNFSLWAGFVAGV